MTDQPTTQSATSESIFARWAQAGALLCFALYVLFAPHSIAGAWIALSFAILCWLVRTLATRRFGFVRTAFDVPAWTLFALSIISAALSYEPRESLAKLSAVTLFLIFYLTHSVLTQRAVRWLTLLLLASGVAGVLWGAGELVRGRGVIITEIAATSPLKNTRLQTGDCIWRVGYRRVASVADIDEALRNVGVGRETSISVISRGEHVEWRVPPLNEKDLAAASASGLAGGGRTHRFRASGWTRHYETFAEVLQLLAQLALGLALAHLLRRGTTDRATATIPATNSQTAASSSLKNSVQKNSPRAVLLFALMTATLAAGIALTAMRTTLVAFACGAMVVLFTALRSPRGAQLTRRLSVPVRVALLCFIPLVLSVGALVVWQTRDAGALSLRDPSSNLRFAVARRAIERIPLHPFFGHGMDTLKYYWTEWGFPGEDRLHTHSTFVQIAFERGIPALLCWLWLMWACWKIVSTSEKESRASEDVNRHGFALGACGALVGFFASSVVNYNFGDSEVALLLFWIVGVCAVYGRTRLEATHLPKPEVSQE